MIQHGPCIFTYQCYLMQLYFCFNGSVVLDTYITETLCFEKETFVTDLIPYENDVNHAQATRVYKDM